MGGDGADEALRGVDVVEPQDRRGRPCHQEVAAWMEGHAGERGRVCHRPEGLLGRCLAVVKELDCEVVGAGCQDCFFRVKFETGHFLKGKKGLHLKYEGMFSRWYTPEVMFK